ncbi:MAG: hypothetical protein R3F03_10335 [Opitutaceae bacterium]
MKALIPLVRLFCLALLVMPAVVRSAPAEQIVELPPFAVEENAAKPWRYAAVADAEIVSRCPDDLTVQLIRRQYRLHELLTLLLPRELQIKRSQPRYYVFYNAENQTAVNRDIVAKIETHEANLQSSGKMKVGPDLQVGLLPNFRFWDDESLAIFFVIDPTLQDRDEFTLSAGYIRYLMESRAPAPPDWFVEGLLGLYDHAELSVPPLRSALDIMAASQNINAPKTERDVIRVRPLAPALFGLAAVPDKKAPPLALAPIAEVLGDRTGAFSIAQIKATATLFMRWAYDPGRKNAKGAQLPEQPRADGIAARTRALWRLAERAANEPMTEALLQECLGLDYAAVDAALRAYAASALNDEFTLRAPQPVKVPAFELRDATPLESSRVRGELARLEIDYVREVYPALVDDYVGQARRILRRAHDLGETDARLLASIGLCEVDARNDAAAHPFLSAATQGGVVRARAWYELARIEFEQWLAAHPGQKPSREALAAVLAQLGTARTQLPPMPEVYELYARIWTVAELPLGQNMLTLLNNGLRLFPNRVRLLHQVAVLMARHGRVEEARGLTERALILVRSPELRRQLEALQKSLPPAAAAQPEGATTPAQSR